MSLVNATENEATMKIATDMNIPKRMTSSAAPYYQIVQELRQSFPQPVSDRVHDAYFGHAIMQAIDQVDALKSETPVLGEQVVLDFASARDARLENAPSSLEAVTNRMVQYLNGCFIWGHPKAQIHVVGPPNIAGIIGALLPSIYNPNLVSDEYSRHVALAEVEVAAMVAHLVGYRVDANDEEAMDASAGIFTFGGTGTLLYAAKIGIEKACPGSSRHGLPCCSSNDAADGHPLIVCSDRAHYACRTAASWLGLGDDHVVSIPTHPENDMDLSLLEDELRGRLARGQKIACIVATMGTTDAFGLDDLQGVVQLRERLVEEFELPYVPHVHADAVIGWAWSVFNDYDFERNELGFPGRTVRSLAGTVRRIQHLNLADSIGVDFHKTGFAPYVSSLFLSKTSRDLYSIARDPSSMPYLFKTGQYHPGKFTLETSRSGGGPMSALASLVLLGKDGLRSLLGHLVTMAETLAERLEAHPSTTVVNGGNFGPDTLFRVYPDGVDTFSVQHKERNDPTHRDQLLVHNEYNRKIFQIIQGDALKGRGVVLSLTECYRETEYHDQDGGGRVPIVALKSYVLSPFSDAQYVNAVLSSILDAREQLRKEEEEEEIKQRIGS
jgi:L-2,4-diaminobutyrate decarboxylase